MSGLLTAASERLRRRPGRPRKTSDGDKTVTSARRDEKEVPARSSFPGRGALVQGAFGLLQRLLGREAAAQYLGVSVDTVDRLMTQGELRRVRLPVAERRILFDRADLDRLIDVWKESA